MNHSNLSTHALESAEQFIKANARPLEQARFQLHFDNGAVAAVLDALAAFQNDDGGFGHGLEPDIRAPESSAICTTVAFQILKELRSYDNDNAAEPMVEAGIRYLLKTLDHERLHWRIVPLAVANSPRAPWWHEDGRAASFDEFSLNPTAEILGILYDYAGQYADLISLETTGKITERVMRSIASLEEIEMHDLYCCLRLLRARNLPATVQEQLQNQLIQLISEAVVTEPEKWSEYGLRPLDVVDSPDSPFFAGLQEAVSANLNFEIAEQSTDGAWLPTWSWGGFYPEDWEVAKVEWAGVLTLNKLRSFQTFGRLES